VDRVNERIAYLYKPTHPAIRRLIKQTIDVGHEHDVWTGICGEMAGNPLMAPLLVGLGIDELSVSPTVAPLVKDVIRSIRYSQAEDLAKAALASQSPAEVMDLCRQLTAKQRRKFLKLVE
jgi:phosphotransferase system enzyme I (PtsI)